MAKKNLACLF